MESSSADWLRYFEDRREQMQRDLGTLVQLESPSHDPERVSAAARWLCGQLRERGVDAETRACPPRGEALVARGGGGGGGTLLLGHHDTVWPAGTIAELPFRIASGTATGPGVFDMKGGLVVALAVMEAHAAAAAPPVTLLSTPDEEVGGEASRELLLDEARRAERVLVLEPSLDGAVKVARKGTGQFRLSFRGVAAHAGLEPEKGASALGALARAVLFCESLANEERGTTVVPTVARAGSAANVVPEEARLWVDARSWSQAESERVEAAIRGYRSADARVALTLEGGFDRLPLEPTPESRRLYERARGVAAALGRELPAARVGGASDGNLTAAAGIVTLDGLGPRGAGAHARDERLDVEDLPFRAALIASLLS